jgi:hypothetical protein
MIKENSYKIYNFRKAEYIIIEKKDNICLIIF